MSASFRDKADSVSAAATPTSATGSKAGKKTAGKKAKAAAQREEEDSGVEERETKKVRTNFGAGRK